MLLQLPGLEAQIHLSATEAVDLLEQLRVLAPVMAEETARIRALARRAQRVLGAAPRPALGGI